jgi:hypothetical protein
MLIELVAYQIPRYLRNLPIWIWDEAFVHLIWVHSVQVIVGGIAAGIWAYQKHRQRTNVHIMALNLVRGVPLTPREKETMLEILTPPPPPRKWWWPGQWCSVHVFILQYRVCFPCCKYLPQSLDAYWIYVILWSWIFVETNSCNMYSMELAVFAAFTEGMHFWQIGDRWKQSCVVCVCCFGKQYLKSAD